MIRVGIIGMGRSGWELHAAALSQLPDYQVAGVCDQSPARLAEAAQVFNARAFTDPDALIHDEGIDLVVVAVPGHLHKTLAITALEAGKHVVVEKPMANSLADADAMLAAANKSGRLLAVFHNRNWDKDYQMVKALVQEQALGELLSIDARVMTYGPEWANYGVPDFNPQWRIQAAYGGGFLADWGPHLVLQCLELAGAWPTSISCQLRSQLWATEVDDYFFLRLGFPTGLLITIEGSNNARIPMPRWFVVGRTATLIAEGAWGCWTTMQLRTSLAGMTVDVAPQCVAASSGGRNYDVGDDLSAQFYANLNDAITTGQPLAISTARARDVIAILEAAREANANGVTVAVPAALARS